MNPLHARITATYQGRRPEAQAWPQKAERLDACVEQASLWQNAVVKTDAELRTWSERAVAAVAQEDTARTRLKDIIRQPRGSPGRAPIEHLSPHPALPNKRLGHLGAALAPPSERYQAPDAAGPLFTLAFSRLAALWHTTCLGRGRVAPGGADWRIARGLGFLIDHYAPRHNICQRASLGCISSGYMTYTADFRSRDCPQIHVLSRSKETLMSHKLAWMEEALQELRQKNLYTTIRTIGSPQGPWLEVDGKRVLNFCSNNYLGLANDPRLVQAARDACERLGVGPAAVRTIAGTTTLHLQLEDRLARFKEAEAAVSFQSGFCANVGTIPALVGPGDAIFSDELNHASIIDGCRLSRAEIIRYPHSDPPALRNLLCERRGQYRHALLVTDGVFSMDGDIAPLADLAALAEEFDCLTMVDDAHGEGVMGHGGRGIVHHFGLQGQVDAEIGTMSKAFGVVGGYVAGKAVIVEWLRQRGRPFLFSSAMTPADTAACLTAVTLLEQSTEMVERLWKNTHYLKGQLQLLGFDIGHSVTPITPVMLGDEDLAQRFSRRLFEEGLFATAIAYPTVPLGKARIRVMLSAAHERGHLDDALTIMGRVGREMGVIQ
jgi:glycine C-acetyltransferase